MILANELRVGKSIIEVSGKYIIPTCLKETHFTWLVGTTKDGEKIYNPFIPYTDDRVKPIPLTEDILLKCGAKYLGFIDEFEDIKEYCLGNGITIDWHVNLDECGVFYNNSCISYYDDNNIKLHQLQNLYFVLTGKELEVNL